jgi:hypothetical protein
MILSNKYTILKELVSVLQVQNMLLSILPKGEMCLKNNFKKFKSIGNLIKLFYKA